jgi:hypothetical protein
MSPEFALSGSASSHPSTASASTHCVTARRWLSPRAALYSYAPSLALFLPFAGVQEPAIDSPWTFKVKHYSIAKIRAEIPLLTDQDEE